MYKSWAQKLALSTSSKNMGKISIQVPGGRKQENITIKAKGFRGGVGGAKMDCHSLNKTRERGVRKPEKRREQGREE